MQTTQAIAVKTLNSSRFWHWQLKFLYDTLKLYFSPKRRHLIIKNKKKRREKQNHRAIAAQHTDAKHTWFTNRRNG